MRGPVITSFELGGPGGGGGGGGVVDSYSNHIKIYFTIIVTNSKCICYVGKANLSVLSLWLFRSVRLLNLS